MKDWDSQRHGMVNEQQMGNFGCEIILNHYSRTLDILEASLKKFSWWKMSESIVEWLIIQLNYLKFIDLLTLILLQVYKE